jgi:FkbM family methyltransferase
MERSSDAVLPPVRAVPFTVEGRKLIVVADETAADSISRAIGRRDPSIFTEFRDVADLIPPGSTVLDVGAHIGVASLYYRSRGHRVVSFEPSAANAALLRLAREANAFDRWTIVEAAVSDRDRPVRFYANGPEGHIVAGAGPANGNVDEVPAVALDAWLEREPGYAPIGLIKMDIEGAEVLALAGARHLLSGPGAPALFIESNGHCLHWFAETTQTLRRALAALGYAILGIRSRRPLRPTSFYPVEPDALQGRCVVNYFCVKSVAALRARGARVVAHPIGRSELLREVGRSLRSDNADERAYIERALSDYPDVLNATRQRPEKR